MSTAEERDLAGGDAPTVAMVPRVPAQRGPSADEQRPDQQDDTGQPPAAGAPRRRRRLVLAGVTGLLLLAAAGTTLILRGDIPYGTTVLGLDLGGKSRTQATTALREHLPTRTTLTAPVRVAVDGRTGTIKPADVGLHVDVEATITAATRGRPAVFSDREITPITRVDPQRLHATLRRTFTGIGEKMRPPAIVFTGTTPKAVTPRPGRDLNAEQSAHALRQGWLRGDTVTIPLAETRPATSTDEVNRLLDTLARPAVAAPVTLTTPRGTLSIPPTAIAQSLTLTADPTGRITPRIDDKKLRAALTGQLPRLETAPRDARFTFTTGRPRITAGADGTALDLTALAPTLLTVLPQTGQRTVQAAVRTVAPKVTTTQLTKLGIAERVSTFTTKFPGGLSSPRSQNIVQIAKEVDGALVLPGQTFSLNGHTGVRGYAQGYKDAPVILGGKLTPGVGGGASQFTTTLFNATYYAGLQDVEHKPHSYYFSRYPPVIESTIFYPDLDFKFKNNTRYGVYLDTSWTANTITVSVWSTKVYDKITTQWGPRRNITTPRTITLKAGPDCIATDGINGFTQDAYRLFHTAGKVTKRQKFTWTYGAEPNYICSDNP